MQVLLLLTMLFRDWNTYVYVTIYIIVMTISRMEV